MLDELPNCASGSSYKSCGAGSRLFPLLMFTLLLSLPLGLFASPIVLEHTPIAAVYLCGVPRTICLVWTVIIVLLAILLYRWITLKYQMSLRTQELQKANLEMEKRVEERTEELGLAMQQAQVADMLKSAFMATMSHELRTPLNSILGFTGILLQELPGKLNAEQRKQLQIVQNSSRHLLDLINDVLDVSKIEAGELDLKYSKIALHTTLHKLLTSLGAQAARKGLEQELHCSIDSGTIITDERRFIQIILNLLSNSIKFTDQGMVSLICERDIELVKISVKDTGIGIPNDQLHRLFRPFYQIDSGLTRKYEGSGLGLYIANKMATLIGGDISLQSELGQGSTFILTLPCSPKELRCQP